MSLTKWINNTFMVGVSKVYHRCVFTIGIITLCVLDLFTLHSGTKRVPPKMLSDITHVSEERRVVK